MNGSPLQLPDFSALGTPDGLATQLAAVVAFVIGLSLWCVGRKTLRAATCVMGALLGMLVAGRLSPHIPAGSIGPLSNGTITLIVGGVLGVVAAIAFYRVVMAGLGASTFGAAAILISMVCLGVALPGPTPADPRTPETASSLSFDDIAPGLPADLRERLATALAAKEGEDLGALESLNTLRHAAASQQAAATETWAAMGDGDRSTVLSAGLVAGLIGLLMGAIAPVRTAAFITALAGSALWMGALGWLIRRNNLPGADALDQPAGVLLVAWAVITMIGIQIQMASIRRDASAPAQPAPAAPQPRPV